jgi:excisionase family DNA binding protein
MDRLALTIKQAVEAGGPGRAKMYEEIRNGRLRAVKIGKSTRILVADFQAYLTSLPAVTPNSDVQAKVQNRHRGRMK